MNPRLRAQQAAAGKRRNGTGRRALVAVPTQDEQKTDAEGIAAEESRAETFKKRLLRLALDVHDGPMQNLTVIGLSLGDLRQRIQSLVPQEHQTKINSSVEQITDELVQVEQELRSLITALEEGATQSIPLLDAIESEIREFKRLSPTNVELVFDGNARVETDSQRIALQAITRAALTNVAKHAKAENVKIRLQGTPTTIKLEIVDDGRGFETSENGSFPGRFGLVGMRERAEMLGGELRVVSKPGGPTTVCATLKSWRPPTT